MLLAVRTLFHLWLVLLFGVEIAFAQKDPHLAYMYPAGLPRGTTRTIVIGGQHLENVESVHVAGTDVEVKILSWYRPMTRGMYNNLRMKLNDARDRLRERGLNPTTERVNELAGVTPYQLQEMEIFRERERDPRRQPNEQLEEELTVELTVADNAKPGKREFRLLTESSMSNPFWIHLGTLEEFDELELNEEEPERINDSLPFLVNGQIMPGDEDRFTFFASEGTRLVINAGARDVIPYLADAVPGWFQAILTLADSQGNTVANADSFYFAQDPVILYEVPKDDWYTVSIRDSLYRGREDFVYRMTIGELPVLTSFFPLGLQAGTKKTIHFQGWNLTETNVEMTIPLRDYQSVHWVSLPQQIGPPLKFPLQVSSLPESVEQEPNDDFSTKSIIRGKQVINGRIDKPGDIDVFRIETSGRLVIDVEARRHYSPLDSMLTLVDEEGAVIASNDDYVDKTLSIMTHHADSHLEASVTKTKPLYLLLTDAQGKRGDDFVYLLNIRSPEPDFELRVVPSTIIASAGAIVPVTVFALRKDGFEGDIKLALDTPPEGFELHGGFIPDGVESSQMTLRIPANSSGGRVPLKMLGQARARRGKTMMTRPALPAENMMQAFIWYHLVPVDEWNIIIDEQRKSRQPPYELAQSNQPVSIPLGGEHLVPARLTAQNIPAKEVQIELVSPPPGVSAEILSDPQGRIAVKIMTDAESTPPGWRGNLLFHAYRETEREPTETNLDPSPIRTNYGLLPAFAVEIQQRAR